MLSDNIYIYTDRLDVLHISVGLAQAHPNYTLSVEIGHASNLLKVKKTCIMK